VAVSDFGVVLTQTTLQLRTIAESNMTDACIITRPDPDAPPPVMDPVTMQYPDPAAITVYEGKCRLQIKSVVANASQSDAGDRQVTVQEMELQLPVTESADVVINDVAKMVTCELDPSLVDHEFTVKGRHGKSQATARRLRVEEVTA
jgi:hypothetical protein